jgi:hypothetical protein
MQYVVRPGIDSRPLSVTLHVEAGVGEDHEVLLERASVALARTDG